jgi:tRNA(Ile)-lysidine synthase
MAEAHGLEICRSFDWLRFAQPSNVVMDTGYRLTVHPPGVARAPGTGPALCLELVENSGTSTPLETVYNEAMGLDWERLSGSLELRNWAPGDRYRPFGSAVDKKLKTLFHVARIPVWERRQWPVLVNGKAIVWTRRFGACAEFASGPETRTILRIREMEAE